MNLIGKVIQLGRELVQQRTYPSHPIGPVAMPTSQRRRGSASKETNSQIQATVLTAWAHIRSAFRFDRGAMLSCWS